MKLLTRRLSENGFVARPSEKLEGKSKIPDFERECKSKTAGNVAVYYIEDVLGLPTLTLEIYSRS